jgi:hypothetical protein
MTDNQIMTYSAVGFAVFSLWWITRKPADAVSASQPAQAQRDAGLQAFLADQDQQAVDMTNWDYFNTTYLANYFKALP